MRLLLVIGAGASYDAYTNGPAHDYKRIPLANNLFEADGYQNAFLNEYNIMGLAAKLRQRKAKGKTFNVEAELEAINALATARHDLNTKQSLFKARFYLQKLIHHYAQQVLMTTSSHTSYIDLLNQLKDWIEEAPGERFVDIVTFNYDLLLERAMENVYGYDWAHKQTADQLKPYIGGNNIRIYKPHGSINWGRILIAPGGRSYSYTHLTEVFASFNEVQPANQFVYVTPDDFFASDMLRHYIPAIAVPFGNKTTFDECPLEMLSAMKTAINAADKIITIGWRGTDKHFVQLLKNNIDLHVVSPSGESELEALFPRYKVFKYAAGFSEFVSRTAAFEELLARIATNSRIPVAI